MKTTWRISCPASVLLVSDLIFEPCVKVQLGHRIEKAFYPSYYCSLGLNLFYGQTTSMSPKYVKSFFETFDLFKIKLCLHTKSTYIFIILDSRDLGCENNRKS